MFDFSIGAEDTSDFYRQLLAAADSLTAGQSDPIANMANVAALLMDVMPGLNWAGFYRNLRGELVLGPFQGRPACIRIKFGDGVCGTAAQQRRPVCVEDVHAFPGHIACDAASASELAVPIEHQGLLLAILDLDSPVRVRFGKDDVAGCVELARLLGPRLAPVALAPEEG